MSEENNHAASSELELDGKIYLITKDNDGNVISKDELDGETCLKVIVAVLDDALSNPLLDQVVLPENG